MNRVSSAVTVSALREWAERIGLPLDEAELPQVAADVSATQTALAAMRRVELGGLEPIVIFDPEHGA
jgi:hypothetical protein